MEAEGQQGPHRYQEKEFPPREDKEEARQLQGRADQRGGNQHQVQQIEEKERKSRIYYFYGLSPFISHCT